MDSAQKVNLATALEEIRERYAARPGDVEGLITAVEAILKLHKPHVRRQNWPEVCHYDNRRWPCPEVEVITRSLAAQ